MPENYIHLQPASMHPSVHSCLLLALAVDPAQRKSSPTTQCALSACMHAATTTQHAHAICNSSMKHMYLQVPYGCTRGANKGTEVQLGCIQRKVAPITAAAGGKNTQQCNLKHLQACKTHSCLLRQICASFGMWKQLQASDFRTDGPSGAVAVSRWNACTQAAAQQCNTVLIVLLWWSE